MMDHKKALEAHSVTHTLLDTAFPLLASHALIFFFPNVEKEEAVFCSFLFLYNKSELLSILPRLAINP